MLGLEIDDGDASWSEKYESVDLRMIPLWDNGEPSESMSSACAVAKGQNGLALQSCNHRMPFVCKYHACLKGKILQVCTQIAGLQIYGGPGSLSHDFKIWPITFQGSGPSGSILF